MEASNADVADVRVSDNLQCGPRSGRLLHDNFAFPVVLMLTLDMY